MQIYILNGRTISDHFVPWPVCKDEEVLASLGLGLPQKSEDGVRDCLCRGDFLMLGGQDRGCVGRWLSCLCIRRF